MLLRYSLSVFVLITVIFHQGVFAAPSYSQSDWMGYLVPHLPEGTSLLELSLPGTHDTNTFDLSDSVADNANSIPPWASILLHQYSQDVPTVIDFIKKQARSQNLNLTQQLDAGIRFLDFRVDWSAPPNTSSSNTSAYQWYSLHLLQSKETCLELMAEVRSWLLRHPSEIVVFLISHHGKLIGNHFHSATPEDEYAFFRNYTQLFGDLVFSGRLNETSVQRMIQSGKRAVFYTASYQNMTRGGSPLATDAYTGVHIMKLLHGFERLVQGFENLQKNLSASVAIPFEAGATSNNAFSFLPLHLATLVANKKFLELQVERWLNLVSKEKFEKECGKLYQVPGMKYCPKDLLEGGQLGNYYFQWVFQQALNNRSFVLPGVMLVNAVGTNGTICTAVNSSHNSVCPSYGSQYPDNSGSFAYVDSVVLYNLIRVANCTDDESCGSATFSVKKAIMQNGPAHFLDDPAIGRLSNWPIANLTQKFV